MNDEDEAQEVGVCSETGGALVQGPAGFVRRDHRAGGTNEVTRCRIDAR